jgi:hypothetical protein
MSSKHFVVLSAGIAISLSACSTMPISDLTSDIRGGANTHGCIADVTTAATAAEAAVMRFHVPAQFKAKDVTYPSVAIAVPALLLSSSQVQPAIAGAAEPAFVTSARTALTSRVLVTGVAGFSDDSIPAEANAAVTAARVQAASLVRSMAVESTTTRFAKLFDEAPSTLKTDKVFLHLFQGARQSAATAQSSVAAMPADRQPTLQGSATTVANISPKLDEANAAVAPPADLNNGDFKSFAKTVRDLMVAPKLAVGGNQLATKGAAGENTAATPEDSVTFKNAFVSYFSAYYNGEFVDRSGTTLTKPSISRTISDAEIASTLQVMWQLIFDYTLRTPVWKSGSLYYPGATSNEPTAVTANLVTPQSLLADTDSDHCGITALKAQAIQYLSNAAADRASSLGGMVSGSAGGLHFGLGVMGKLSIGDNQALQAIVQMSLSQMAGRAAEEASWRALYWIPYNDKTLVADLVQQFLDGKASKSN